MASVGNPSIPMGNIPWPCPSPSMEGDGMGVIVAEETGKMGGKEKKRGKEKRIRRK